MKFLNIKFLLMVTAFLWVSLSFYWFSNSLIDQKSQEIAQNEINSAKFELLTQSRNLKFKLGQWTYNYNLVKTKGADFDNESYANSEFETIFLFNLKNGEFVPQWSKSKDVGLVKVPNSIYRQLKKMDKDSFLKGDYFFFSDDNQSKIYFGFPVADDELGEGAIVASLDQEYLSLLPSNSNTYLVDENNKFIYHPNSEYIAKSAKAWLSSNEKTLLVKSEPLSFIDGQLIYRKKLEGISAQMFMPTLVMMLGLLLIAGILIFEFFMAAPLVVNADISAESLNSGGEEKDEYLSVLKLNKIRDSLNKMSLLSTVIKGRLDLASLGETDKKLMMDIKNDYDTLENLIDATYKESQKSLSSELSTEPSEQFKISDAVNDSIDGLDLDSYEDDTSGELEMDSSVNMDLEKTSVSKNQQALGQDLNYQNNGLDSESDSEGVVFQEYLGEDTSTNDWAKIIDELTDEINNIEIKPKRDSNIGT